MADEPTVVTTMLEDLTVEQLGQMATETREDAVAQLMRLLPQPDEQTLMRVRMLVHTMVDASIIEVISRLKNKGVIA